MTINQFNELLISRIPFLNINRSFRISLFNINENLLNRIISDRQINGKPTQKQINIQLIRTRTYTVKP